MTKAINWIREPFCSLSHFAGFALSIAALVVLLIQANGPWQIAGVAIYGASLILLYGASTIYHTLPVGERGRERLMRLDHISIYVLIAGTYVPVCLIALRGGWGWTLLGIEYGLAVTGILVTLFWKGAPHWVRMVLYILMGWLAALAITPLRQVLGATGMFWLVAGGVIYSVGAVIYALDRPHLWPGRFSAHDLWHVFVLGGSACHFVMVLSFVGSSA